MQRYFAINDKLEINNEDYYHIITVMRMKNGDKVEIVYENKLYICEISSILSNSVIFNVIEVSNPVNFRKNITIAFSLLNEQKTDYVLQKGTELGCNKFIPLQTNRSVIKFDYKKSNKKIDRWSKICKEASEQSKRLDIPSVSEPIGVNELINLQYDIKLLCSVNEKVLNIKKVLQNSIKYDNILIVIGPEGGFTDEEENLMIKYNFVRVSLGNNVLRAETAPLYVLSVVNYEYME